MGEYNHNNSKLAKIICVLLVFILTITAFSPLVSAYDKTRPKIKDIIIEKIETSKSSILKINLQGILKNALAKRIEIIPLHVITKYNNTEKTTKLRLLLPTSIDVDGDGDKDVRVSVFRHPGLVFHPLAFSIKTSLVVKRLPGMNNIKNSSFEIYLEYIPRFLSKISGGTLDRVRIGYQSPEGEEIPDSCTITHTYALNLIYLRRMPTNSFSINPGSIDGKNKLNLLVSIADMQDDNVISQNVFKIDYNPAVKSDLSISRMNKNRDITVKLDASHESKVKLYYTTDENNDDDSVGFLIDKLSSFTFNISLTKLFRDTDKIEYKQVSTNPVNVTLFKENSQNLYFYVKNLPDHIVLSFLPECEGWMDVETFDKKINEAGFCDDLTNPTWSLYFSNLPTLAKLAWSLSQEPSLGEGRLHISSDTNGCSIHLRTKIQDILNTVFNADVNVDVQVENDINMTMSWNLSKQHLKIEQSQTDLNLSMSIYGENGNNFTGSCLLKHVDGNSLDIYYDDLRDKKINFSIASNYLDLYNLDLQSYIVGRGNFSLQVAHMLKKNVGNISINLYAIDNNSNIVCNCSFEITGGIDIYNLTLGYNGQWYNASHVYVAQDDTFYIEFGGEISIDYYFSSGLSSGYISIGGSLNIDVNMSLSWNGTQGGIIGKIRLKSISDRFNISWDTIDGQRRFTLDGNALVSLSDFRLWFGKIIDISIPTLSGSLKLTNMSKQTGDFEFEFQGSGSLHLNTFFSCSKSNRSDVLLKISIDAMVETDDAPALIAASWDNYNVTSFTFDIKNDGFLSINDLDIKKTVDGNQSLKIENLTAQVSGFLQVNITRANATRDTFVATTDNANVDLHIDCLNTSLSNLNNSCLDLGSINISMSSAGRTVISLLNITNESYFNPYYDGELLEWNNITMSISANNGAFVLNEFFIEHLSNYSTVSLKNFSIINGYSKINFDSAINRSAMIIAFANIRFNNTPNTNVLLNNFSFDLVLGDVIPPVPTTIYSGKLIDGIFDARTRLFDVISVEITNGSAIDHLGMDVVPFQASPGFHFNVYLYEPVSYLFLNINSMEYKKEYILIDTHNTSIKINLMFLLPDQNISITPAGVGFCIDNVTLQADKFVINTPNLFLYPENVNIYDFNISGYIHLEGGGNIWVLVDGVWYPLYQYNGSLTVTPGHMKIEIDGNMSVNRVIPLSDNSTVTIKGNFTADNSIIEIWWERMLGNKPDLIKIEFNGNLNVEDFLFKVEYSGNDSLDKLIISWDTLNVLGLAYFNISQNAESLFNISGSAESFDLTNFELNNVDNTIQLGSTVFSGEFSISTLPMHEDSFYYIGLKVREINGIFEIDGIAMPSSSFDKIDGIYFDGVGDINFENWEDAQSNITIYFESQNGFIGQSASIQLDTGRVFEIVHLTPGNANVSSGFVNLSWNIDGDSNGMIFLDSSSITLGNARISYWKPRHFGWGIRLGITGYFDADAWLLQWFPLHHTGHIYHGMLDIDLTDGDQWYNLWPPFHFGEMNEEHIILSYSKQYNLLEFNSLPSNS